MKKFLFLSTFLHIGIFSLVFSWEIPRAERLPAWSKIKVTLIEKIEEKEKSPPPPPRKEDRRPVKKKLKEPPPQAAPHEPERKKDPQPSPGPIEKPVQATPVSNPDPPAVIASKAEVISEGPQEISSSTSPAEPAATRGGVVFALPASARVEKGGMGTGPGKPNMDVPAGKGGGSPAMMGSISPSREPDSILLQINRRIEAAKRYPKSARKMGIEGVTTVRFKITPRGAVEGLEVVESSGSEILDRASLETVRAAVPLPYKEGWLKVGIVFKIL